MSSTDDQLESPARPLLPIRRLSNFVYCPRLFVLQWVENLFVDDAATVQGSAVHRRVDSPSTLSTADPTRIEGENRSLGLESVTLGITGVIDFVACGSDGATIVEYKKGSAWRTEDDERIVKDWDRIQVVAQALLLREHGYPVKDAYVFYAEDRRRVPVAITPEAEQECLQAIAAANATADKNEWPPPLEHGTRCQYCSAFNICLPWESKIWEDAGASSNSEEAPSEHRQRPPLADNDTREVLVVQRPGTMVSRRGGEIQVQFEGRTVKKTPARQLRGIYLFGPIQVSAQVVSTCLEEDIALGYFSGSGRFLGLLTGLTTSGIEARQGQYQRFSDNAVCLNLAKSVVRAKIHNQRVVLMRNSDVPKEILRRLKTLRDNAAKAKDIAELLGVEGSAAATYFSHFSQMLKGDGSSEFNFEKRNRRPPRDPVNALLSLGYSVLVKETTGVLFCVGLDPYFGFYHQPKYGRPALALDLMEEFRPIIADSVVLSLVNRNQICASHFAFTTRGVYLTDEGRKIFWEEWFKRLDTEVRHPLFDFKMSYRRMIEIQARLLWRVLRGQAKEYQGFTVR